MNSLILHAKTRQALDSVLASGAHAVLLSGDQGSGKETVAVTMAAQLLDTPIETASYYLVVRPNGKSIGIKQIRELQKFLQLKTTGQGRVRRIAIILDADTMTTESQNALLKVLEEPPEDTVLLLTAHKPHQLRPTIHSRVQTIGILPPVKTEIVQYFTAKGYAPSEVERAYMLSNGHIGLMTALLQQDTNNTLTEHISVAKSLYSMSAFERLTKVDALSKDKDELGNLLFACKRICVTALEQAALKQQQKAISAWHRQLSLIVAAEESLRFNPNAKLLLTDLFIQM